MNRRLSLRSRGESCRFGTGDRAECLGREIAGFGPNAKHHHPYAQSCIIIECSFGQHPASSIRLTLMWDAEEDDAHLILTLSNIRVPYFLLPYARISAAPRAYQAYNLHYLCFRFFCLSHTV